MNKNKSKSESGSVQNTETTGGYVRRLVMASRYLWLAFAMMSLAMVLQYLRAQMYQQVAARTIGDQQELRRLSLQVLQLWTREPLSVLHPSTQEEKSGGEWSPQTERTSHEMQDCGLEESD